MVRRYNRAPVRGRPRKSAPAYKGRALTSFPKVQRAGMLPLYNPQGFKWFRSDNPFKPRMSVKMAYSEIFTLTTGGAGVMGVEQVYNLNDVYDPNFTGVGHQPYGRDTLAAIYGKYKVTGVKIDLTFTNPSADGVAVAMCVSPPNQAGGLSGATVSTVAERQNSKVKYLNATGSQKSYMGFYMPMHVAAQVSKLQFKANIENYSATSGASPTTYYIPHLRISAGDVTATGAITVQCAARITYYTTWYDRVQLAQS